MIKINVITNNTLVKYIKNQIIILDKKIINLIKKKEFKKKNIFALYYFQEIKKLNILIKNLEKKIKQQTYYHFHFKQKKSLKKIKKKKKYILEI